MEPKTSLEQKRSRFRILQIGALVIGLALASAPWKVWLGPVIPLAWLVGLLQELLPKLGDALMIAPLLTVLIEVAAEEQVLDSFVRKVSLHIIGHLLPEELRHHLMELLGNTFVRTRWFIEFRIEMWPKEPNLVRVRLLAEYEAENRSYSRQKFPFIFRLDQSRFGSDHAWIEHVRIMAGDHVLTERNKQELEALAAQPKADSKEAVSKDDTHLTYSNEVIFPPQPHAIQQFLTESVECFPDFHTESVVSRLPVLYTTLRVLYPKDSLEVNLRLSFADEQEKLVKAELIDGTEWIVQSPILPGQCLFLSWRPKDNGGGATATQVAASGKVAGKDGQIAQPAFKTEASLSPDSNSPGKK